MNSNVATELFELALVELSPQVRYGLTEREAAIYLEKMLAVFLEIMEDKKTMELMVDLKEYDETSFLHSVDLFLLVGLFALSNDGSDMPFMRGALLHDIGKTGVPLEILQKNGKLTVEEYEIVKSHTTIGHTILANIGYIYESVLARSHHERLDGSGYPDGLTETMLGKHIRWIGILDVYSALTLERPYKPAFTNEEASALLSSKAKQYDTVLVADFSKAVQEVPNKKNTIA